MNKGLVIDFGSERTEAIYKCLKSCLVQFTLKHWSKIERADISTASWFVMSGSPTLLTEIDKAPYMQVASMAFEREVPLLAICFSHQLLGLYHGVEVRKMQKESRESINVSLEENSSLFHGLTDLGFDQDHCEEIDLPNNFFHLASSKLCKIEAMKHITKTQYGVQFHPETSGINGLRLFQNFFNNIEA